jgi:hypothetical protein
MNKNVGAADRYIRFLVGISFLLNIIILTPGVMGTVILLALGLGMIYTSFAGFCWLYGLLKIGSCGQSCAAEAKAE